MMIVLAILLKQLLKILKISNGKQLLIKEKYLID